MTPVYCDHRLFNKACVNKGLLNSTGIQRRSGYDADCETSGEEALVARKWDFANLSRSPARKNKK